MKRKICAFGTGPSGVHYIKMQYSGISTLVCYVDGFTMHGFPDDRNTYLKLNDVITWYEKEYTATKKERYRQAAHSMNIARKKMAAGRIDYA